MKKDIQIGRRRELAIKIAKKIGNILLDNFKKPIKIRKKGDRNFVTDIDLKAEKAAIEMIKKRFPEDAILSEESPYVPSKPKASSGSSPFRWVIDPLDGTHNFIHNIDIFGTSIAVEFKGEVVIGVIYMPPAKEFYVAQKGKGAYLNGKRIAVSKRELREATLVYDSSIRYNKKPMLADLGRLVDRVFNVRMYGSTVRSLSYIAEGRVELEVEYNDKPWDFAAGLLLVEEAGGKATDFKGNRWNVDTERYIASNGIIHKSVLRLIKGCG